MARFTLVGIGEALFDIVNHEPRLGGAPLNVACHAHQLAQPHGGRGVIVSRIGQDELGNRAIELIGQRGMTTDFLETDPDRPTGRVYVHLNDPSEPTYEVVPGVAWDNLQFDPDLEDLAQHCDAVCFGTLAQRDAQTRNTLYRFLDACPHAMRLLDVNLRADFDDARLLQRSLERATHLKLNQHEWPVVTRLLGLAPEPRALLAKHPHLQMVALTRGSEGVELITPNETVHSQSAHYPQEEHHDSVGAGDACAAGLLVAQYLRKSLSQTADLAHHCGAFVASQSGATPALPKAIVAML